MVMIRAAVYVQSKQLTATLFGSVREEIHNGKHFDMFDLWEL